MEYLIGGELSFAIRRLSGSMLRAAFFVLCSGTFLLHAAELPIREVILYKHGVGFFERSGSIPAGESAQLDFKASEMNDVLKSLIINGKNERVAGLRYDSGVPLDQKLAEFPFRVEASQPLSSVLDQLKGAKVEMQVGAEKVSGAIIAARTVSGDKDRAERQQIVLLMDSGDMRTFDLDAASSIRLEDPRLQTQFRDYLGALTAARSKEKRSVYIDGNTAGGRDITAQYIIPTAMWKSSYRLLFGESGEPTLEGWAIVDNTTDEDWNNVQMALVSGKPISFISELYAPRYVQRELAELPEQQAQKPVLYQGAVNGVPTVDAEAAMRPSAGLNLMEQAKTAPAPRAYGGYFSTSKDTSYQRSSITPSTSGIEIADLFEYRIAQPVTIKRDESAMLPFLQDKIKARKVVVYSDMNALHPLNAAELVNSTGKTLDGGPITVYDGGSYVGEALVETVKANDKRLVSYGVDLGTRVTNKIDSQDRIERELHLNRGILTVRVALVRKTEYAIHNVDSKAKTLIIEHPLVTGFRVLNQKPVETTASVRRFELTLGPNASETFPVTEEQVTDETVGVSDLTPDVLIQYTNNKGLTDAGRRDLQQIVDLKRQIAANSSDSETTRTRISNVTNDETRVRQNLASLNSVSGQQDLVQKYASQLAQLEQQIATLRDHEGELGSKNAQLQASLNNRIENLSF